ncbi:MAG: flagellar biosynthetic protein FliP [Phycisphaerae bacterium]|nr:flagellar biosynthetic protein FliP [Phycisphaerae bacterium]
MSRAVHCVWWSICLVALVALSPSAAAQSEVVTGDDASADLANPVSIIRHAGVVLPGRGGPDAAGGVDIGNASAPQPGGGLSASLSILILLTVLTIAPALFIMTTSFTRIVVVLSLLRQAIGTQSLPPGQVIIGLSLFMTLMIMAPTFERIHRDVIVPMNANEIDDMTAWVRAKEPMRDFMFSQIDHSQNWRDVEMLLEYRGVKPGNDGGYYRDQVDMLTLIPAFMLSELKVAFLMGFRLYLPFLIIDMVIASVLISMSMLMLPPVLVSLPFKLLLFVLVDGWHLVAGNLLNSFALTPLTG